MKTPAQWCKNHYPVEADQFVCTSDTECLGHSIDKWEGLREDNLPPNWSYSSWELNELAGPTQLYIDDTSCALCQKYLCSGCEDTDGESCPIVRATGTDCALAYKQSRNNPEPMIALLKSTLEFISTDGAPQ